MKSGCLRALLIILTIAWMGIIFYYSSQDGSLSANMSGKITNFIIQLFIRNYADLPLNEQSNIYKNVSYLIRKIAHFSEYGILSLLLFFTIRSFTKNYLCVYAISFVLSCLYAMSDEFHQSFVADRLPLFKDVLIDSLGSLTMLLFIACIINIIRLKRKV